MNKQETLHDQRSRDKGCINHDAPRRVISGDSLSPTEAWRVAPARVIDYYPGTVLLPNGNLYRYPAGKRLEVSLVPEEFIPVMDTAEAPWAVATVNAAFSSDPIDRLDPRHKLRVLERGAGLNITATKVIDHLVQRGSGEYHIIELNEQVLNNPEWGTKAWKKRIDDILRLKSQQQGIKYDIDIQIHEGEAQEITKQLAADGKKFNIIISDTFPIEPEEQGINDIADVDVLTQVMYGEGVFAFFAYYPGIEKEIEGSHIAAKQLGLLRPKFGNVNVFEVGVKPPRDYPYLFTEESVPVTRLPVVICRDKKKIER